MESETDNHVGQSAPLVHRNLSRWAEHARSAEARLSNCSVVVHISHRSIVRKSDQTMVTLMQSYCFIEVSQLALKTLQTCEEVDQPEGAQLPDYWSLYARS